MQMLLQLSLTKWHTHADVTANVIQNSSWVIGKITPCDRPLQGHTWVVEVLWILNAGLMKDLFYKLCKIL